jgi:rubrerythrin
MPRGKEVAPERLALLDRLGARLAFERVGVRLYDAMISKYDAYGSYTGGPTRDELMELREAERDHVHLLRELVLAQGGDPTAITPSANLQLVATRGLLDVVVDPRTTLVECLDAALLAELADLESWRRLAALAHELTEDTLGARLERAAETEEAHLSRVRGWVAAAKGAKQ